MSTWVSWVSRVSNLGQPGDLIDPDEALPAADAGGHRIIRRGNHAITIVGYTPVSHAKTRSGFLEAQTKGARIMFMFLIPKISLKQVRLIAADVSCDQRTVTRALLGLPTRAALLERITEAAPKYGVDLAALPKLTVNAAGEITVRP